MIEKDFRLYTFVNNVYMSPTQWGIQSAHVVGEMSQMYFNHQNFIDWVSRDKTIIVCQGGPVGALLELETFLKGFAFGQNGYNFAVQSFREDEYSLGGVITAVGIIIPEALWNAERIFVRAKFSNESDYVKYVHVDEQGNETVYKQTHPLFPLVNLIKTAKLA